MNTPQRNLLVLQESGICKVNEAVFNYTVYSLKPGVQVADKDYYLSINTNHKGQKKKILSKACISEKYETKARDQLRSQNVDNPSPKRLAKEIGDMVDKDMEEICKLYVVKDKELDTWIDPLTKALYYLFVQHENDIPTSYNHLLTATND